MLLSRITTSSVLIAILISCGKKETVTPPESSPAPEEIIMDVQPTLLRFSWPEYLAWKERMDRYYDTDLSGITDTTLLNDIASYDPVDMGWGDSNFADTVYASSVLAPQGKTHYRPENSSDRKTTAWIEGVEGTGEGEWILFHFNKINPDEPLTSITIYNGFQLNAATYAKNSRVKVIRLYVNETARYDFYLQDSMKGQQFAVDIRTDNDQPVVLKFEIRAVYEGTHYQDTGLTEIEFDGVWGGI